MSNENFTRGTEHQSIASNGPTTKPNDEGTIPYHQAYFGCCNRTVSTRADIAQPKFCPFCGRQQNGGKPWYANVLKPEALKRLSEAASHNRSIQEQNGDSRKAQYWAGTFDAYQRVLELSAAPVPQSGGEVTLLENVQKLRNVAIVDASRDRPCWWERVKAYDIVIDLLLAAPTPDRGVGTECDKCEEAHKALDAFGVARGAFGHSVRYRIGLLAAEELAGRGKLIEAVRALYYSAHWTPDRPVDAAKLWTDVRDAAGFVAGSSPKPIIQDRSEGVALREALMMRVGPCKRCGFDEGVSQVPCAAAPKPKEAELRELVEAAQWVIEWEEDYRTRNNLGRNPPMVFINLAKQIAPWLRAAPATRPAQGVNKSS